MLTSNEKALQTRALRDRACRDVATHRQLGQPLAGLDVASVAFSPDGRVQDVGSTIRQEGSANLASEA